MGDDPVASDPWLQEDGVGGALYIYSLFTFSLDKLTDGVLQVRISTYILLDLLRNKGTSSTHKYTRICPVEGHRPY